MSPRSSKNLIAALDIGTTKVAFLIGQVNAQSDGLDVIGVGQVANHGVKQGAVINIDATVEAITKAKDEAELMAGQKVDSVWLGVSGTHVQSFSSSGMVAIKNREVSQDDVDRVIEAAKAVAIPNDRMMLHVLPNEYKIDQQEGIHDPIGMSGVRLEASVHIVSGSQTAIQNSIKCCDRVGLRVEGLVLQPLAAALAVVSEDERQLGVTVIDMGGGTCDMITFSEGCVVHTGVVPVGGNNFTHDIAMGLRTTQVNAEKLKVKYGCALKDLVSKEESIEVQGVGGRKERTLSKQDLCEVIEARADETWSLIKQNLESNNLILKIGSGVILCGGASQLLGFSEMGEFLFDVPVRRGTPIQIGGLTDVVSSPQFATGVGLLSYGLGQIKKSSGLYLDKNLNHSITGIAQKVRDFFRDTF